MSFIPQNGLVHLRPVCDKGMEGTSRGKEAASPFS